MQYLDCDDCVWYTGQRSGKIVCAALTRFLGELERDPPYPGECRLKNIELEMHALDAEVAAMQEANVEVIDYGYGNS